MVAADDAGFLKQPDPAQAGRSGQTDLVGQLHVGEAAVALQGGENPVVEGVKF
ncbi:hypothetical protein D9M68_658380 [compost metagenome]